jgi:hypothetical protein
MPTRRTFLHSGLLATAASALLRGGPVVVALLKTARADVDIVRDTLNGLLAFVVPGLDTYSVAQGVSTVEAGGVDAGVSEVLSHTLDLSVPFLPQFSATVAGILNSLAQAVNPGGGGSFASFFANLSFPQKAAVFQIMDSTESLKSLGGVLPAFVAYLVYSDAGAFDPATRSLTGQPVGWTISDYSGTADGRNEFRGYLGNRRSVQQQK